GARPVAPPFRPRAPDVPFHVQELVLKFARVTCASPFLSLQSCKDFGLIWASRATRPRSLRANESRAWLASLFYCANTYPKPPEVGFAGLSNPPLRAALVPYRTGCGRRPPGRRGSQFSQKTGCVGSCHR